MGIEKISYFNAYPPSTFLLIRALIVGYKQPQVTATAYRLYNGTAAAW